MPSGCSLMPEVRHHHHQQQQQHHHQHHLCSLACAHSTRSARRLVSMTHRGRPLRSVEIRGRAASGLSSNLASFWMPAAGRFGGSSGLHCYAPLGWIKTLTVTTTENGSPAYGGSNWCSANC
jgi:hypothetical protein